MSEETTAPERTFETGFVILVDESGSLFLETAPEAIAGPVKRAATLREVRRYISEVLLDINAQSAAEYTVAKLASLNKE